MIVRNLVELTGTEREVWGDGWRSRRLLSRDDGVNFSLHLTEIDVGTELELEYANHFEANYCIAGSGEVTEMTSRNGAPAGSRHHVHVGPARSTHPACDEPHDSALRFLARAGRR